jgi:glycogen phosphorylase
MRPVIDHHRTHLSVRDNNWRVQRFRSFNDVAGMLCPHLGRELGFAFVRAIRRLTVQTLLPESLEPLGQLVTNLRWSWHQETQELFAEVDPVLWETVLHDPVRLLGEVSGDRLEALSRDRRFLRRLRDAIDDLNDYLLGDRWYQSLPENDRPRTIAYFSPEFGVTQVLPQYSGGLGILAGDHLKAASDLGVPVVGVGLLYRHGYFGQTLSREGWQQERYPVSDPDGLPLNLLREHDGSPARVIVGLPGGRQVVARIWLAQVGRVPLLMLDTDVEENTPAERDVTDRLYGGSGEHRLLQEIMLGIGGVRALRIFCRITDTPAPEVFHSNEGHAGFLGVERIREHMQNEQLDFDSALEVVRAGTIFTTHTPVPAGIDRFPRDLIMQYFGADTTTMDVPIERVLALGAETYDGGDPTVFNMAVMGLRLAQRANGVSRLHGEVSRAMFAGLWPHFDQAEVPIGSITNGVHAPTWVAPEVMALTERAGGRYFIEQGRNWAETVEKISDADIWRAKRVLRQRLVAEVRTRLRASWLQRGASEPELGWVDQVLDPDILTIGFARRGASYKRLTLMLRDPVRLRSLLLDPHRPVQIVIAGKAHPADDIGKRLIQDTVRFADQPDVRHRMVFLPNYDIGMAQILYPGCDVWLNNPLRPFEACGTSGMKAALNGALNVSVRDGWWDEWFDGENGWAIPSATGVESGEHRDDLEAAALYDLIEGEVAPRFYDEGNNGLPPRWLEMVRHTLTTLGPKVLATRMVREYVETLYLPAAQAARRLNDTYDTARVVAQWKHKVTKAWPAVRVEHVEAVSAPETFQLGGVLNLRVFVALGDLTHEDVAVQVVHGRVDEADELREPSVTELACVEFLDSGRYRFEGGILLNRTGAFGYTVRVVPNHSLLMSSAELGLATTP